MNSKIKKISLAVVLGLALLGSVWAALPSQARHCDGRVNVVECGTYNHQELKNAYYGRSDVQAVFNWAGINTSMIEGNYMTRGVVYRDGRIVVNGKVVATGAATVQRGTSRPGASYGQEWVGGTKWWKFSTQNSFLVNYFNAFVWMDNNGRFMAAAIYDCGNPVWATAVEPPKPPTPPKPPVVPPKPPKPPVVPPKPQPVLTCDALKADKVARNKFKFTAQGTAKNGATISKYTFNFGDTAQMSGQSNVVEHEYKQPGTYTVTVTINDSTTSTNCRTTVTVQPEPTMPVCDLRTGRTKTIKESEFNTQIHTKDVKQCDDVKVCEISTGTIKVVDRKDLTNKNYSTNLNDCKKIEVCVLETGTTATINQKDFDAKKHGSSKDCEKLDLCEISTGNVVPITQHEYNTHKNKYTTPENCEKVKLCRISDKSVQWIAKKDITKDYTDDFSKCAPAQPPQPPQTPPQAPPATELPKTGLDVTTTAILLTVGTIGAVSGLTWIRSKFF